jgi:Kdo2-lipid IVA lauroyltransferase/acyltransferase
MIAALEHSFRLTLFNSEQTYRLAPDALEWRTFWSTGRLAYSEISRIRLYKVRSIGAAGQLSALRWRCALHARAGTRVVLAPDHYRGLTLREDRKHSFDPFVNELITRVSAVNPGVKLVIDRPKRPQRDSVVIHRAVDLGFRLARRLPPSRIATTTAAVMRAIGPFIPEHRIGRENLAAAFPEKSPAEIERVLRGVWDNLGRVGAELAHLDRICDVGPGRCSERIVMDEPTIEHFERRRLDRKPALIFSAHLANWELPALVARACGVDVAALVRAQRHSAITDAVARARSQDVGAYIYAGVDSPARIKSATDRGADIAVLIDQNFAGGIEVDFFGRPCKVAPILGRLARSLEWPIKGIRAVRLPDQRFRVEVVGPIDPPRDARGRIDVAATMQVITAIVEGWVRQHPDQWLWLHRRWR